MAYFNAPYRPADLTLNSDAINNDLVGFWPLTDGSGSTAVDVSTGGNDGTLNGGASWGNTDIGTAFEGDGVDGTNITVSGTTTSQPISVSCWMRTTDSVTYAFDGPSAGYRLAVYQQNGLLHYFAGASAVSLGSGYNDGQWHHIVVVFNGSSSSGYVDGVLKSTGNPGTSQFNGLTIGSRYGPAGSPPSDFSNSGNIQNIRVFDAALTSTQVEQLYTRPWTGTNFDTEALWLSPPSSPVVSSASESTSLMTDCVLWYPLTDGSGTTATDLVGSNDGTLAAGAAWDDKATLGTALELDGSASAYATTPTVTTASQPVTHSVWFRYEGSSGVVYIMDGLNGSFRNTVYFSSGQMWVYGGSSSGTIGSSGEFNDGEWHNLTAVFNGSSSVVYIDGVQEASGNYGSHSWQGTTLGARFNFTGPIPGDLQNYRVWERALTAEEARLLFERPWIGAEYNESDPLYPPVPSSLTPLDSGNSINTDLELWLPLTDGSGTTATDISGGGNDGTINGATWANREVGTSLEVDATSEYVESSISSTVFSSSFTVASWIKWDSTSEEASIIGIESDHGGSNYTNGEYIGIQKYDATNLRIHSGFGFSSSIPISVSAGDWVNIVWSFDPSTNTSNVYANGVLLGSVTLAEFKNPLGGIRFCGGANADVTTGYVLAGQNVRVWSRSLSSSEAADLYYEPWIGSAYPSTGGVTPSYFVAAQFNRLGIGPRFRRL